MRFDNDTVRDTFHAYLDNAKLEKKDYQLEGVTWCVEREMGVMINCGGVDAGTEVSPATTGRKFIRGGIVADEMGLGKTIMMLGICLSNMMPKTLIVLPFALLDQWWMQIYKTTGHKAIIYHGANKKKYGLDALNKSAIVLTTYGAICGKLDKMVSSKKNKVIIENDLHKVRWNRIIFDEAHHLRNKNTMLFLSALRLKAGIRWFVTGTPIQNNVKDFYSLCLLMGMPASFIKENIEFIRRMFVLKRSKADVGISLSGIETVSKTVSWGEGERGGGEDGKGKWEEEKLISQNIHALLAFSGANADENGDVNIFDKKFKFIAKPDKKMAMILLIRAKQSCISSNLLLKSAEGDEVNKHMFNSSKINSVVDLIGERIGNGNGKIVFCDFHEEMDIVEKRLRVLGVKIGKIDSRVKKSAREELLNDRYDVLIIQINSGSEGLNLQDNYSEVYFISPHWNPSIEDQAIGRCYRFGQKKCVSVFRFEMDGFDDEKRTLSVERHISNIQNSKRAMISELF
jgi:SNF2 family DNA or RNA helicase